MATEGVATSIILFAQPSYITINLYIHLLSDHAVLLKILNIDIIHLYMHVATY